MCSTYCSFASAQSRRDDRDSEKGEKRMGKQEVEKWWDLPISWGFGVDLPLCDALWAMGTSLPLMFCFSKPFWSSRRSCLRNWGTEGFAVGMVSWMFRDFSTGGIWSWLVSISPIAIGEASPPQGDPSYPKISTELAVRDIFLSTGYCGIPSD